MERILWKGVGRMFARSDRVEKAPAGCECIFSCNFSEKQSFPQNPPTYFYFYFMIFSFERTEVSTICASPAKNPFCNP